MRRAQGDEFRQDTLGFLECQLYHMLGLTDSHLATAAGQGLPLLRLQVKSIIV